jgi:hypothetical protein
LNELVVVATRRSPPNSLIENWFSNWPGTSPEATYEAVPPSPSENSWMRVGGISLLGCTPVCGWYQSHGTVAR